MPLCFPLNRHMVCGSLPLRTPPVRACYALFLAGAVVVALPPRCIGQTDTTPAPTDSTTRPTHSYFIDAARLTREGAVRDVGELLMRSEEHTSELQSRLHLVCRLLLEKKKKHN